MLRMLNDASEAEEEKQQQLGLRHLQSEAVGAESVRSGLQGQGPSSLRTVLQHVS